jgi:hypothetical protein
LTGYVQADSIPWSQESVDELEPSSGRPLNEERFLIRRGRLGGEAHRDDFSVLFELDGNTIDGPVARILAASVGWSYRPQKSALPLFSITAGLQRTPFGFEVPLPERVKPFMEPPAFARALFPGNFDAGVMVAGAYGAARWSFGIFNGTPVEDRQWQGVDPLSSYDLVGRVGIDVAGPRRSRFEAGVSAISGKGLSPGTPPTKDDFQWIDSNQDGFVQPTELIAVPGAPGTPSQPYARDAIGLDARVHWCLCKVGKGWAFFEGAIATNLDRGLIYADPIRQSRDLRQLGFAIGVVQDLGPRAQVGVRYDRYDADADAFEQLGVSLVNTKQVFSTLGVMGALRHRDARFVVQYDRERNPFGRDDAGMPVTRSADRLTLRGQVGF